MRVAGRYVKQAVREGTGEVAVGVVSELAADARATVAATRDRALLRRLAPSSLSAGDTNAHQC